MTQAGFGHVDITPAERTKPGGVHDPLLATACVIRNSTTALALVGIDAVIIDRRTCDAARAAITDATSIPAASVLISASHTHTGGRTPEELVDSGGPGAVQASGRGARGAVRRL